MIPLEYFVALSMVLFSVGILGILTQRSAVRLLFSIELILNSANINFVAFNSYLRSTAASNAAVSDQYLGWAFAMIVVAIAAAEAAIALAIFISLYRNFGEISVLDIFSLAENTEVD